MAASELACREAAAAVFSFQRFPWREVAVPAKQEGHLSYGGGEAEGEERVIAGGWSYRGSSLISSPCRNRFVLWSAVSDEWSVGMGQALAGYRCVRACNDER